MASHVAAFSTPIILLIGIIFAADPWVVLQVNNEKIITGKVLALKRDIQATFYFMLEISQAIIGMILLYIVTNYSIKQKVTKKKQTNQDNQSILGRAQIVQEQLKKLDSENGDGIISESDEMNEDLEIEEEEVGEQDILFKEALEKFRNQYKSSELEDEEDSLIMQNFLKPQSKTNLKGSFQHMRRSVTSKIMDEEEMAINQEKARSDSGTTGSGSLRKYTVI